MSSSDSKISGRQFLASLTGLCLFVVVTVLVILLSIAIIDLSADRIIVYALALFVALCLLAMCVHMREREVERTEKLNDAQIRAEMDSWDA